MRPLFLVGFLALAAWNVVFMALAVQSSSTAMMSTPRDKSPINNSKRKLMIPLQATDYIYSTIGWDRAPIVVESHKLIFFTVPKVACTVWKQLFRRMEGHHDWKIQNKTHDPKQNGMKYLYNYSLPEATSMLNDPKYTKAIFVRDPKSRFLSAYLEKAIRKNWRKNETYVDSHCCHRRRRHDNNTNDNNRTCWSESSSSSSRSLADFFELTKTCSDPHWIPLHKRLEPKFVPLIDFIGNMDNAADDAKALLQRIGAWEEFGTLGWGKSGTERIFQSKSSVVHITSKSAANAWSGMKDYYTPDLERVVEERFSRDYDLFGIPRRAIEF